VTHFLKSFFPIQNACASFDLNISFVSVSSSVTGSASNVRVFVTMRVVLDLAMNEA
jgi:hypothetical protein